VSFVVFKLLSSCVAVTVVEGDSRPFIPTIATSKCRDMRIGIINGVSFHFEVLAGILHVLKGYEEHIDVFMSPWVRKENYDGENNALFSADMQPITPHGMLQVHGTW
jgi:hypothetical protein